MTFHGVLSKSPSRPTHGRLLTVISASCPTSRGRHRVGEFERTCTCLTSRRLCGLQTISIAMCTSIRSLTPIRPIRTLSINARLALGPLSTNARLVRPTLSTSTRGGHFHLPPFTIGAGLLCSTTLIPGVKLRFFFERE